MTVCVCWGGGGGVHGVPGSLTKRIKVMQLNKRTHDFCQDFFIFFIACPKVLGLIFSCYFDYTDSQ